ncbi:MAG: veratrol--corrinoid protein metyltransferase [Oscillospiraceae bacterium]|nr:veratrol--corrinoid protein metyltransferase [Oscillospiraceae bacterium]
MLSPKENYLTMLRGNVPEYVPSPFEPYNDMFAPPTPGVDPLPPLGNPISAPNGPVYSAWGVRYVGSEDNNWGALPEPGFIILDDITKWRDVIKNPDMSGFDWEDYFRKQTAGRNSKDKIVICGGVEYFQTLISFLGFNEGLLAMYEEPDEVYALLDYISEYATEVTRKQIQYTNPDILMIGDDCAAYRAPFFSPDMYKRLIKPFHKKHADIARDAGLLIAKHDCGRSEDFIEDWLDIGVCTWNPAQVSNDLVGIKKKYVGRLAMEGCWDNQGRVAMLDTPDDEMMAAVEEYVKNFAPGGGFVYSPMVTGDRTDPRAVRKMDLIKEYFFSHVRNYYS